MANQPNFIPSAFAASGDKNTIPASDGGTGAASFAAGFPPKAALPLNAGGVAPDRKDFNGIFNILSQFAEFQQSGGTFGYSATQDYTKGAVVTDGSTGALYVCILANGPGTSAGVKALTNASYWRRLMDASTVMTGATSSTAGAAGVVPAPAAGRQGKTLLGDGTWGQDPDIAAAKAAGQIGGAAYVASDNDLNNYLTAGIFYFSVLLGGLVNGPADCTNGYLTVSAVNDNSPTTQRFVQSASGMYVRTKPSGGGAWTSWVREAVDTDVMTGATASTSGTVGLVPAPAAGQQGKTLLGSGTWGQDADIAAAKAAGQIGGAAYVASDNDLNNYLTAGIFYFSVLLGGLVNGPADCTNGYLTVSAVNDNSPTIQRFVQSASGMYVRTKPSGGGAWTSWVREAVDTDVMTGATSATPGKAGLVPAPAAGQQGKTLLGDGTWGQDPDIVSAKRVGQIGHVAYVTSDFDLDNYTTTGQYYFSILYTITNAPPGCTYGYLSVSGVNSSSPYVQTFVQSSRQIYLRTKEDSGTPWTSWVKISVNQDVMTGATASTSGTVGLVPAPAAGQQGKTLLGSGTWGQDPDIVSAKSVGQIGSAPYINTATDANDLINPGCYNFAGTVATTANHFPTSSYAVLLFVFGRGASPTKQLCYVASTSAIYMRQYITSTWSAWVRISPPSPHASDGTMGDWVPIQGGTWNPLDGQISAPGACQLPSGGTWCYFVNKYFDGGIFRAHYAGVAAGGTTIVASATGNYSAGFAWRIA